MDTIYWILLVVILGPLIGSFLGILISPGSWFLSGCFGFAAGVMIAISFISLIPESMEAIALHWVIFAFMLGFSIMFLVDRIIPHFHPITNTDENASLERTALTLIAGIALHNLPEGFAVGASFSSMADLGLLVAIAITVHDIPETIVPVSSARALGRTRRRAFSIGWLATAPTILGLMIGIALLHIISAEAVAFSLSVTAGFMIYIAGDELLPASQGFKFPHITNFTFAAGILMVIALHMIV